MSTNTMRATTHNARAGKTGAFSPKHNDRNFNLDNASNIDKSRTDNNWYWHLYYKQDKSLSFDTVEKRFYTETFSQALEAKNQRYKEQRHPERIQTIDAYRSNPRSCPEETILQIGNLKHTTDPQLLKTICIEYVNWERRTFPNIVLLDLALHMDEQGAPHIHERKVWIGHDKDGNPVVGQDKALREMGIEPPLPDKKLSKFNNPKITYTKLCREQFIGICRSHELDIELTPKEATKSGLSLLEYQSSQEQQKITELNKKISELEETVVNLNNASKANVVRLMDLIKEQEHLKRELVAERTNYDKAVAQLNDAEANMNRLLLIIDNDYEELNKTVTKTALSNTEEPRKASAELLQEIKANARLNNVIFGNGKMRIEIKPSSFKKLLKALEQQEQLLLMVEKYKALPWQISRWESRFNHIANQQREAFADGCQAARDSYAREIALGRQLELICRYPKIKSTFDRLYEKALLFEAQKSYNQQLTASQNDDSRQRSAPIKKKQQKNDDYER